MTGWESPSFTQTGASGGWGGVPLLSITMPFHCASLCLSVFLLLPLSPLFLPPPGTAEMDL